MPALPNTFFSGVGPETLNGNCTGSNDDSSTMDNFIFLTVGILIGLVLSCLFTSMRSWLEYGNFRAVFNSNSGWFNMFSCLKWIHLLLAKETKEENTRAQSAKRQKVIQSAFG
ncbi:UNVERIFIED_CONTAM: hypothetical protein FKN15_038090 [Acipenser sinensis]